MSTVGTDGALSFSFESRPEDFYNAACAVDHKNRTDLRRNLQSAALVLVFFMFIPPENFLHWGMLALCVAVALMLWKYPEYVNRKFAKKKAAASPKCQVTVTEQDITLEDAGGRETIPFNEGCAVYQFRGVLAVSWGSNRLTAIPLARLDGETKEKLTGLLKECLKDRYETLSEKKSAGGLFSRRADR